MTVYHSGGIISCLEYYMNDPLFSGKNIVHIEEITENTPYPWSN